MNEPLKVLLVDDIPENLVALAALLRRPDVELLSARTGAEALELLLVHDVSLALLDVQMPELDGFELAELMRGAERTKHVPIIFVTAGARDPRRVFKGYESGAVDFLFKPIDPHVLRSKVDVFLELARQRRELASVLRLNEIFVGILGHDLRNPLSTLIAGCDLLLQQVGEPGPQKTVRRMQSASRRMTEMVEQLLDLTRARLVGGLGLVRTRTRVDVRALVQRTLDELRLAHPDRELHLAATGDCTTSGDPDRLVQLFSNLLGNAVEHGAAAPIVAQVYERPDDVLVQIRNRGVIAPELVPSLFEPFRGRHATAPSTGLGLGLYIARQIALAHGGDITVESSDEAGTVFTVRIPRTTGDGAERVDERDARPVGTRDVSGPGRRADRASPSP